MTMADVFNRIPPCAVVRDWLGKETVERLLRFAQSNERLLVDSGVYSEDGTESICHENRASKTMGLGNFKGELKANDPTTVWLTAVEHNIAPPDLAARYPELAAPDEKH